MFGIHLNSHSNSPFSSTPSSSSPSATLTPSFFSIPLRPHKLPSAPEIHAHYEPPASEPIDQKMANVEPEKPHVEQEESVTNTPGHSSPDSNKNNGRHSRLPSRSRSISSSQSRSQSPGRRTRRRRDRHQCRSRSSSPRRSLRESPQNLIERGRQAKVGTGNDITKASGLNDRKDYSSSPNRSSNAQWKADYYRPQYRQRSPLSKRKFWMDRVEELARTLTLVSEGTPEGPKAERITWEQQVEALGKQISRSPSDVLPGSGESSASSDGRLDHRFPPRPAGAPRGPRFSKGNFRAVGPNYYTPKSLLQDAVMTLNYDDPVAGACRIPSDVAQDPLRLSRPSFVEYEDLEMADENAKNETIVHDAANVQVSTNFGSHAPQILSTAIEGTNSEDKMDLIVEEKLLSKKSKKGKPLKSTFSQLQSWISSQPPAQPQPLPAITRDYTRERKDDDSYAVRYDDTYDERYELQRFQQERYEEAMYKQEAHEQERYEQEPYGFNTEVNLPASYPLEPLNYD